MFLVDVLIFPSRIPLAAVTSPTGAEVFLFLLFICVYHIPLFDLRLCTVRTRDGVAFALSFSKTPRKLSDRSQPNGGVPDAEAAAGAA